MSKKKSKSEETIKDAPDEDPQMNWSLEEAQIKAEPKYDMTISLYEVPLSLMSSIQDAVLNAIGPTIDVAFSSDDADRETPAPSVNYYYNAGSETE